jgi:hypothetical protein
MSLYSHEMLLRRCANLSASRLDLWPRVIQEIGAKNICEIGVWKGEFAEEILSKCSQISSYYMIDPWANLPDWNKPFNVEAELFDQIYQEAMSRVSAYSKKVKVLRGRTKEEVCNIDDDSLDFVYIDGDHTLRGITIDLQRILPKVRTGGIIAGDDFVNTPWQHSIDYEPTLVCPYAVYFAEAHDLHITALPFNQFAIQKTTTSSFNFLDLTENYSDLSLNKLPK